MFGPLTQIFDNITLVKTDLLNVYERKQWSKAPGYSISSFLTGGNWQK